MATAKKAAKAPPAKKAKKTAAFKVPSTLAACADMLGELRKERYALQHAADAVQKKETALREHLIAQLPKDDATGVAGKLWRCAVEMKEIVIVNDWDKVQAYVVKNARQGAFALLQRRISDAAVQEIWEKKGKVPGTEKGKVPTISVTKRS